ncbi:MAG: hypothetical protein WC329_01670 [Candidatus Omnitrophota bacterium]|jgi:hypothetical protein
MANEAAVVVVAKWKDEVSTGLKQFGEMTAQAATNTTAVGSSVKGAATEIKNYGDTTESARLPASRFRYETIALGAAMSSMGNLIGKIDSPAAKMVGNFLQIAGTVSLTVSSIIHLLPYLSSLAASLQKVAIMQAIVKALSGPAGWVTLGVGLAAGIGAGYGISNATKTTPSGVVVNNYVQGSVVTENQIAEMTRREIIKNQDRNSGSSGIHY